MNYEYSKTMKELMKKNPNPIIQVFIIFIMAFLVGGIILGYTSAKEDKSHLKEDIQEFDSNNETLNYSKLTPEFLSEGFASNYDDSVFYCFAIDKEYNTFIVAIKAEDMDQYQELIDYTYDDTITEVPAQITLQGVPEEIDDEIAEFAVESYSSFWGSDEVDINSYQDVLGYYYLDTTQEPAADYGLMILSIFLFIVLGSVYILYKMNAKKITKRRQATLDKFDDRAIWAVDQEINQSTAIYFNSQKMYCTNNYIVSSIRGFDIIPLEEIIHVYGCIYGSNKKGTNNSIVVITRDGIKHEIAIVKMDNNGETIYNQIMEQIKQRLPEIQYGFENSFYTMAAPKFNADIDNNEGTTTVKSNMLLGILGAILGAALGGVIWIIIGKMGFIAGLAGFAMMIFAIMGYRMFSGNLDKKGQVISLLIAFVMIFVANYTLYALEYCKYYYSSNYNLVNISNAFKKIPEFLTYTESWVDFIKDLVIGYALSIWSGIGTIKSTFSRRK